MFAALAAPAFPVAWLQLTCETSVDVGDGVFTIELHPEWSPRGVERVVELQRSGFFDGMPFFRAISGFLIQFGITPDREKARHWNDAGTIADDPRLPSQPVFTDGVVSFAGYAKDSRSTHLFITLGTQPSLGKRPWEVPVGVVTSGIDVVHNIYTGYGDRVDQGRLSPERAGAAEYLKSFPKMSIIKTCRLEGAGVSARRMLDVEEPEDDLQEPADVPAAADESRDEELVEDEEELVEEEEEGEEEGEYDEGDYEEEGEYEAEA